jgi:hypothetical protein
MEGSLLHSLNLPKDSQTTSDPSPLLLNNELAISSIDEELVEVREPKVWRIYLKNVNQLTIHRVISLIMIRHSCESRNSGKHWISGQAQNEKKEKTYVVLYKICKGGKNEKA